MYRALLSLSDHKQRRALRKKEQIQIVSRLKLAQEILRLSLQIICCSCLREEMLQGLLLLLLLLPLRRRLLRL